ncbi:hypothetical protein [Paenibacillus lentus]|uniref:Uncharacterized protein n=1 Tax=Paenibacillus lentus TaxID=1338368 RepID=A0A3Q8SBU6_9BACL|nr:hypothetical protein [Paenibacillus lentus]AZK47149.1 hypothetical protein EIM92_14070 [Paenibacillus lentus]
MSERLSRMERYGKYRNPKDRQHRFRENTWKHPEHQISSEAKSRVQRSRVVGSEESLRAKQKSQKQNRELPFDVYTEGVAKAAAETALKNKQSDVGISVSRQALEEAAPTLSVEELPSRREVYPSQRVKLTKYFFNTLLFIFIAVMVALFWWGISESPWGQNHGM